MMERPHSFAGWVHYFIYYLPLLLPFVLTFLFPIFAPLAFIIGAIIGWFLLRISAQIFAGGAPFGHIHSTSVPVHDTRLNYPGLYYLGRDTTAFSSYKMGPIAPQPPVMTELIAGLIPVVLNYTARSANPADPAYDKGYADWTKSDGITSWALVPLRATDSPMGSTWFFDSDLIFPDDDRPLDGVIVCVAHGRRWFAWLQLKLGAPPAYMGRLAAMLASIGARDAVVMDGNSSVMMGVTTEMLVGPPPSDKDVWQIYGFYCQ
jgi:hypothetical protein